jgi:hypothetical protein
MCYSVAAGYDYGALTANEISHQSRQSLSLIFRPAVFDRKVLSLNITSLSQASSQRRHEVGRRSGRRAPEKPDHRHRRLLRTRCERQRRRRAAAKQDDEIAPSYT